MYHHDAAHNTKLSEVSVKTAPCPPEFHSVLKKPHGSISSSCPDEKHGNKVFIDQSKAGSFI